MGYSIGFNNTTKRNIGYEVPCHCDHPGCDKIINRGMSYSSDIENSKTNCDAGIFLCEEHMIHISEEECDNYKDCSHCEIGIIPLKDDCQEWIDHKLKHDSWAAWRSENKNWVEKHTKK